MPGPEWKDDPDTPRLRANIHDITIDIVQTAGELQLPDMSMPLRWHEQMHVDVPCPSPAYVGAYRGSSRTHLLDYEVHVDLVWGERAYRVYGSVERLISWLAKEVAALDRVRDDLGTSPDGAAQVAFDLRVIDLAAELHGEWVRIHPFANGNGRTARLWVLWLTSRYELPPLLSIRPRPSRPYSNAAKASFAAGDHTPMNLYLRAEYNKALGP